MPFVGKAAFMNERCPAGSRKKINGFKSYMCVTPSGKIVKKVSQKSVKSHKGSKKGSKKGSRKRSRKSPVKSRVLSSALRLQKEFKKKCRKQTDSIAELKSFDTQRLRSTMNRWRKVMKTC